MQGPRKLWQASLKNGVPHIVLTLLMSLLPNALTINRQTLSRKYMVSVRTVSTQFWLSLSLVGGRDRDQTTQLDQAEWAAYWTDLERRKSPKAVQIVLQSWLRRVLLPAAALLI